MQGVITAMITPFKEGHLDEEGLRNNIREQLNAGIDGLLFLGSTGEFATLEPDEQKRIISIAREEMAGSVPLIVNTGHNSTEETIKRTVRAQEWGADAALIVAPYYNRPKQDGLIAHYQKVHDAVDLPLYVYNNPSRCAVNIEVDTLCEIAALPRVLGVKESSGSLTQASEIMSRLPGFELFSGEDPLTLPLLALGASGVISVVSNLVPDKMLDLFHAVQEGDLELARAIHFGLTNLFSLACIESNPIPIKALMNFSGRAAGKPRLPLTPVSPKHHDALQDELDKLQILGETV